MINELEFTELICARYSHDLAGPIGAINNGIEFLDYAEKDIKERAISLIKTSAEQSVVRLQFLRQVYGYIRSESEMSLGEIVALAEAFFSLTKIKLKWNYDPNQESLSQFKARFAKLILNVLNVASTIVLLVGEVEVTLESNGKFSVEMRGDRLIFDEYLIDVIKGEIEMVDVTTKNVHIYYLTQIAKDMGVKIGAVTKDKQLIISVEKK